MNYKINFFFLIVIFNVVAIKCSCPDVPSVGNYDLKKVEGVWYDVAISKNNLKYGDVFADTRYNVDGDKVTLEGINYPKGDPNHFDGSCTQLANGKLDCEYVINEKTKIGTSISVIDVNDDFLSLYACTYNKDKDSKVEIAWVASKAKKVEGEVKTKIENYLNNYKGIPSMGEITWLKKL